MKSANFFLGLVWLVLLFTSNVLTAQIKITFPVENAVFQRNNANQAVVSIGGYYTEAIDRVEARLVPVRTGQGQETAWTVIQTNPQGGTFLGTLTGRGGWYTLEVRAFRGNELIGRDALSKVGVGEVFIIAGQSNAEGIFNFGAAAPADERVVTTTWNNRDSDKTDSPILSFTQVTAEGLIGPRGRSAWCWGKLGEFLVQKLNVPVLLMNVGWNDTSTQNWLDAAQGKPVLNRVGNFLPPGMPYSNLNAVLQYYGSILGIRAVLWLQGENDSAANVSKEAYQNSFQGVVNIARNQQGNATSTVPWVVSRTALNSTNGVYFSNQQIIDAQNAIINIPFNKCYAGPYTDNIQVPRPDGGHFQGQGLIEVARAWDNALPPGFFATVVPVMARPLLPLTVSCNAGNVSFNVKAPDGYASYRWSTGETTQTITVQRAGTYQATMKDNVGNNYLTPALVISESSVSLPTPVITPAGEQIICADSSIALTVDVSSINTVIWSNGQIGRTINVRNPGTYTARITNIFGCSSPAVSAPVTVKNIQIKAPTLVQSGPYSVQATPDNTIFSFTDTKVSTITWDWRQGGRSLPATESAIKVTQTGEFTARSRVTFVANSGGSARTCVSPFSAAVVYQPTGETADGLVVYPNPSRLGKVAIETLEDLTDVEITVTALSGQVVYSKKFSELKIRKEIDLSYVNDGAYILRVNSKTLKQSKRIIIDH